MTLDLRSRRPLVLLVDDIPNNLLALEGMLRRDDVEIATAASGRAALEILLERPVALAIIDVQMPEMDGFELAALMRGVEKTRYVPIIFVTAGSADKARVFKGYEAGAVDYLIKPIDEHILRSKVDVFVTLDRQRQQLREADRMREMFIAVLGHDLRNPLGGIFMAAQLVQGNEVLVQRILQSGERMRRMINQLFDATRFRNDGQISLTCVPADLRELAEQIVSEIDGAADRVRLEVLGDSRGTWDVDRLAQIVSNLVGNAACHSPPGSPILVGIDGGAAEAIVLRVHNGGSPIPEDMHDVLFEPFRRADRGSGEGLGLGLYITKQLTLAHGGTLSLSSSAESGTCFTVRLPRHRSAPRVEAPATSEIDEVRSRAQRDGSGRSILIVEDEPAARIALEEILEGHGYRVLAAANPGQAIAVAAEHDGAIDVLLTDLSLPEMPGDALAERLRSAHPDLQVIFMSGYAEPPGEGAAFVQKPINLDVLVGVIEQALSL